MKMPRRPNIIDEQRLAIATGVSTPHFELYSGKHREELAEYRPHPEEQRPEEQHGPTADLCLTTHTANGGGFGGGLSMDGSAESHRDVEHELMLTADDRHLPGLGDGVAGSGSSSPTGLSLKHQAINNNNTEDFVSEHNKMKEAYGLYGPGPLEESRLSGTEGVDCSSPDRLFESNGEYAVEDEDIHGGVMVIKPMDTEIGISPAQSLLQAPCRRKQLKPCGGRRKQSKPIRVYMDYDPLEAEGAEMPQSVVGTGHTDQPMAVEDRYRGSDHQASQKHNQMEVDASAFPCDFSSQSHHQQLPPLLREKSPPAGGEESEENGENFPTKYHQLGNQLMGMQHHDEGVMTITPEDPVGAALPRQATPDRVDDAHLHGGPRFPSPSSQGDGNSNHSQGDQPAADGSIKRGSRIFHPDAYCELCNREFCNKYFLKTHKANKHGIYDPPSPNDNLPVGMPMPPMPNGFPNFSMPPLESLQAMPPVSMPTSMPMPSLSESLARLTQSATDSTATSVKLEHPLAPPSTSGPRLPGLSPPHGVPRPPTSSTTPAGPPKEKEKSMEDYCELCQKHFCNKYYLKKHKHDVHGIVPATPSVKRNRTTPLSSSGGTSSTSNSITSLHQNPLVSNGMPNMPNMAAMANVMFINPFTPPMFLQPGMQLMQPGPGGFLPNGLPAPPQGPQVVPPSEPPRPTSQQQRDEQHQREREQQQQREQQQREQQQRDQQRREQHQREREQQHQREREQQHQREREREQQHQREREQQHREREQQHREQCEREQAGREQRHREEHQKLSRPPSSSPHHVSLPGEIQQRSSAPLNADAYCELCRKEFCNRYFLKIHKANKHGIFIDDEPGDENAKPASRVSPDKPPGPWEASRASPNADQPISAEKIESANKGDEVYTCKLCNKDFHSKQSFKIHNMNVHGFPRNPEEMKHQLDMDMALAAKMATASGGIEAGELLNNHHPPPMPPPPFALEGLLAKNLGLPPITSEASKLGNTMFGNMIAAKLADRVMCDVCNKEVCNKYFLKTHKLKVHGIIPDPPPDKEKEKEKHRIDSVMSTHLNNHLNNRINGLSGPADLSMKSAINDPNSTLNNNNNNPNPNPADIKRPNDQELLKMGIDPEAYCEICKKEFCSKYFLKTHKQNIHGIKIENSVPREKHRDPHRDPLQTSLQNTLGSLSSPHMSPSLMPSMAPTMVPTMRPGVTNGHPGGGLPHIPPPPGYMPNLFNFHLMPEHLDMTERRSWKWKEPINATRVMCDLCNKELCNKYFLRTHMLNKHGLHWDHLTGQTTPASKHPSPSDSKQSSGNNTPSSTPPVDTKPSPNFMPPPTSMFDSKPTSGSNGSLLFPDSMLGLPPHLMQQLQQQQRSGVIVSKEGHREEGHREEGHREEGAGEGKHVAHTPKAEPDLPPPGLEHGFSANTVTARTWHVPSVGADQPHNMTKDSSKHQEEGAKQRPDLPNGMFPLPPGGVPGQLAPQKCDLCGLLFDEPMTLHLHKVHDHGLQLHFPPKQQQQHASQPDTHTSGCVALYGPDAERDLDARQAAAIATYSLKKKYQNNMKRKFRASRRWRRLGQNMGVIGDKVKSAIMNHIANHQRRKKYRCAHCQERFLSKPLCQAHIRAEHPNARYVEQSDSDNSKELFKQPLDEAQSLHPPSQQDAACLEQQPQLQQQRSSELDMQASDNHMDTTEAKDSSELSMSEPDKDMASDLPVSYATPQPASPQPADGAPQYLMQPFTVQESAGETINFATSIVYLPVMRKVSEPVTVSFRLTPAEQ